MFAYLVKCFVILIGLWLARYFHWIPWNDLVNIGATVIAPVALIAIGMWQAARRASDKTARDIVRYAKQQPTKNHHETIAAPQQ